MKCQHCEKPATFHITELTDEVPEELHLCEEHARIYLMQADVNEEDVPSIAGALAQHLNINEAAEQLAKLDQQACPLCGITFYEFRHVGRLGCPHDYICFEEEIDPIKKDIREESKKGKLKDKEIIGELEKEMGELQSYSFDHPAEAG